MITKSNLLSFLQKYISISIIGAAISGCAGPYSAKMSCPDSSGLHCRMMHEVDAKIDSGEIDKVYKKRCKGKKCANSDMNDELLLKNGGLIKAKIDDVINEDTSYTTEGKYLIIKE